MINIFISLCSEVTHNNYKIFETLFPNSVTSSERKIFTPQQAALLEKKLSTFCYQKICDDVYENLIKNIENISDLLERNEDPLYCLYRGAYINPNFFFQKILN